MTETLSKFSDLPAIRAAIGYLGDMDEEPFMYYVDPPAGTPFTNAVDAPHDVDIFDIRGYESRFSLEDDGFQRVRHDHAFADFDDEEAVRGRYFPEVADMFRRLLGTQRVIVFDYAVRRPDHGPARPEGIPVAGVARRPIMRAHGDFIGNAMRDLVERMGDACGPDPLKGRYRSFNFWRPISGPLTDRPLAVCHPDTVSAQDMVPMQQYTPMGNNRICALRYNPAHRWSTLSRMEANEGWIFSSYDSAYEDCRGVVTHCAFNNPAHGPDGLARDSIEVRILAFGG
jgi:hypothetical protein